MELIKSAKVLAPQLKRDSSSELRFITELGRSLLFTVHPKKVASRVAEAIQREVRAEACAFVVELDFLNGRDKLKDYEIHSLIHF